MAEDGDKLHIAMFPWLAFGHIVPYLEVAKLIAQKGHKISFISTPRNIDRLPKIPPHLTPFIDFVRLPLPLLDDLPLNAEATIDLPEDKVPFLKKAYDGLQEHLSSFLNASKPDWICYDFAPHWLPPIAAELGISRAFLSIFWATSFCVLGSSAEFLINGDDKRTLPEHFTVSPEWIPFPSNIVFRLHEANRLFKYVKTNPSERSDLFRFGSTIAGCQVMAIRSCAELQPQWLGLLQELYRKPMVPLGLIPPSIQVTGETNTDETWLKITPWLGKQEKGSVVYVAFGSEAVLSQEELTELALGLELSGLPFFWALRKGPATVELPNGFEERTRGRGVVWTSWVPQLRILGHESVGVFLTHCGWSSVIEGLSFGLAFVMLPIIVDQGLIARMCEEKQVGVEIPRDENDGSFTRDGVAESLKLVMLDERGKIYKEKATEMMTMIGDKDLHQRYIDNFVEYLQTHRNACP